MNKAISLYKKNKLLIISWIIVYLCILLNSWIDITGDGALAFYMFFIVIFIFVILSSFSLLYGLKGFFHAQDLKKSVVIEEVAFAKKLKLISVISLFSIIFCALFIFYIMARALNGWG